jgi:hypothetical protein
MHSPKEKFLFLSKLYVYGFLFDFCLQLVPRLQRMYRRIEDVDLFIGAISEKLVPGGTLGTVYILGQ